MSNKVKAIISVLILTAWCRTRVAASPPRISKSGPFLGFRYNDHEVLTYIDQRRDTATHRMDEVYRLELPNARAKWGGGGYLLPLTLAQLSHFEPAAEGKVAMLPLMPKGTRVTVQIDVDRSVEGTVDRMLEQWGIDTPIVRVAAVVQVRPEQLPIFQGAPSDYFLVTMGSMRDAALADSSTPELKGSRTVLNDLGPRGQIVVESAETGWQVALWRKVGGTMRRTEASYTYGD